MEIYMILNSNNIAESKIAYNQPLLNIPKNYIKVTDESMLWHKYENNQWSTESFKPVLPTPQPTLEDKITELNKNQLTIMNAIADLYSALPTSTTTS